VSAQANDPLVLQEKRFPVDEVQLSTADLIDPPAGESAIDKLLEASKDFVSFRPVWTK